MLFRYPLMTLKVIAAIHFEAVRLMLKGVRRHPHAPVRHSREAANRSSGVGSDPAMPEKAVQWTVLSDERPEHERRA
jgi:hypothetical protein